MDAHTWNTLIAPLPGAHLLQSWEWGQVKARYGWQAFHLLWTSSPQGARRLPPEGKPSPGEELQAAALVLRRAIPVRGFAARLGVMYVPKGPLLDWSDPALRRQVLADLGGFARQQGAIFVRIDPDVPLGRGLPGSPNDQPDPLGAAVAADLQRAGWRFSSDQVQFRNTVEIDLAQDEAALLANMKQKTRYNVRLAARKGVQVRRGRLDDLDLLYRMYAETSLRDGFVIREADYYRTVWSTFLQVEQAGNLNRPVEPWIPHAEPLIAEVGGEPLAALVVFRFARRAWYMHGMSRQQQRELMPNYLLQWEAMRRARAAGCRVYDLWGAPDVFEESDPLWGVYRFKEGLGGQVVRYLGAWDLPVRPWLYRLYNQLLPRLLSLLRRRGLSRTRRLIE